MEVRIHESWKSALQTEFEQEYFKQLADFIRMAYHQFQGNVYPKKGEIFRAFDACPLDQLKVVILGQDPYPTRGHAHGLCFSCDEKVKPLPKSLLNIFKELEDDLKTPAPIHGDLSHWAEQGVLLLNSILTVHDGRPLSHANRGWEKFTDAVIRTINDTQEGIIFVLWGGAAQQKAINVDENKHVIIRNVHPSPLSAYRGFFGSKPFSQINSILKEHKKEPINWV